MITLTDDTAVTALGEFIELCCPEVEVYRGQINRVPMPQEPFCIINSIGRSYLSYPRHGYTDDAEEKIREVGRTTELRVQVDFYGAGSAEYAHEFCNLFVDEYGWASMPDNVKPLKASDPSQMPLTSAERQLVERWRIDCSLQVDQTVSIDQDFFDTAGDTSVINVPENFQ